MLVEVDATKCMDHPDRVPVAVSCTIKLMTHPVTREDKYVSVLAPVCDECLQEDEGLWKEQQIPVFRLGKE